MADNFLNRLNRNPYAPIDSASVTRVDELGNGYDDWGNVIAPKYEQPQQTWGETALGVATAPARMATALAGSLSPYGQDGWQVPPIIDEGVNALSAVGDAYNYGMDQDEINSRALGMAGFMMGGGGLAARPAGGTGMFAGRLAKTADHEALARAERLAAEGADRRAIWDQTGWFQGPDSKWRFEIDDSGAGWKRKHAGGVGSSIKNASPLDPPQMGGMLDHGDLYSSYPDTKKLYVKPMNDAGSDGGFYNRSVFINPRLGNDEALKTGLHETQHYLQAKEGFAPGGDFSGDYSKLAGEVEARNVERRMNMSADERRATPPWDTQDISDADQIVRLYSNASKEGAIPAIVAGQEAAPVRAYHGTDATIRGKFKTSDQGGYNALFASPDPEFASHFASDKTRPGKVYPLDVDASGFADIVNPEHFARIAEKLDARLPEHMRGQGVAEDMLRQRSHTGTLDWAYRDGVGAVQDAGFSGINLTDAYGKPSMAMFKPGTVRSATTGETLFSNADSKPALLASGLDMGQEARLARAKEMGFDTDKTYYHGTQAGDIEAFDMGRADTGWRGKAVHMADDPKLAEFYGGDRYSPGAIYPLHLRVNNTADYMGTNLPRDVFNESQLADITSYWGAGQADGFFGSGKMTPELASGGIGHDAMMDLLKSQGYDSLMDNGHMMVFDPRNIRSVNAAFDPAKSDSANLLAANADSRPALLGAGQEQDIPDWLLPYLGR